MISKREYVAKGAVEYKCFVIPIRSNHFKLAPVSVELAPSSIAVHLKLKASDRYAADSDADRESFVLCYAISVDP